MKKITVIPETLADLPKKEEEMRVAVTVKIRKSVVRKLVQAKIDTGYSHQEIIDRALEAFLK